MNKPSMWCSVLTLICSGVTLVTMPRRAFASLSAVFVLLLGLHTSAATGLEDRPGRFPGLPFVPCIGFPSVPCSNDAETNDDRWLNAAQNGMAGSIASKQWAPIPMAMTAVAAEFGFEHLSEGGPWDAKSTIDIRIRAFFTSPEGSQHNYGDSALIPVRSLAFGTVPAEITLQIGQDRDANGLPIPFQFINRETIVSHPEDRPDAASVRTIEESPEPLRANVDVRVVALKLDGVNVDLATGCGTGPSAGLELTYPTFSWARPIGSPGGGPDPFLTLTHPDTHFYGASGGSLFGTIDIPAFHGCVTGTGDDISEIITSMVSGDGNPVTAKVGTIGCETFAEDGRRLPNPPGVTSPFDPRAGCDVDAAKGNYAVIPTPVPYPDHAPGAPAP